MAERADATPSPMDAKANADATIRMPVGTEEVRGIRVEGLRSDGMRAMV